MKPASLFSSVRILIASALVSLSLLEIDISSANAHPTLRQAVDALSYPRSSQRFLEKGQAQLETEIKYLQQNALASFPTFRINRDILQQRGLLQQQQERWLREDAIDRRVDNVNCAYDRPNYYCSKSHQFY